MPMNHIDLESIVEVFDGLAAQLLDAVGLGVVSSRETTHSPALQIEAMQRR